MSKEFEALINEAMAVLDSAYSNHYSLKTMTEVFNFIEYNFDKLCEKAKKIEELIKNEDEEGLRCFIQCSP